VIPWGPPRKGETIPEVGRGRAKPVNGSPRKERLLQTRAREEKKGYACFLRGLTENRTIRERIKGGGGRVKLEKKQAPVGKIMQAPDLKGLLNGDESVWENFDDGEASSRHVKYENKNKKMKRGNAISKPDRCKKMKHTINSFGVAIKKNNNVVIRTMKKGERKLRRW